MNAPNQIRNNKSLRLLVIFMNKTENFKLIIRNRFVNNTYAIVFICFRNE